MFVSLLQIILSSQHGGVKGAVFMTHAASSAMPGEHTVICIVFSQVKSSWLACLTGASGFSLFILVVCNTFSPDTLNRMAYCNDRARMHSYLFFPFSTLWLFSMATNTTSAGALICPL